MGRAFGAPHQVSSEPTTVRLRLRCCRLSLSHGCRPYALGRCRLRALREARRPVAPHRMRCVSKELVSLPRVDAASTSRLLRRSPQPPRGHGLEPGFSSLRTQTMQGRLILQTDQSADTIRTLCPRSPVKAGQPDHIRGRNRGHAAL